MPEPSPRQQLALLLLLVPAICAPVAMLWLAYAPLDPWTTFLGRFHPVVLHTPIGVLSLTALMESLNVLGRGRIRLGTRVPLFIGASSAVVAMTLGILLMTGENMEGDLVRDHLIWGIATAALAVVALVLRLWPEHDSRRQIHRLYLAALFGTCGVMTYASHQGASITHGETYLTDHLPWAAEAGPSNEDRLLATALTLPAGERRVYDHLVAPIFAGKCYSCHHSRSFKGRLIMDTPEGLMAGGASGPAIEPGSAQTSLTLVRVHLPLADEEHMPPASDPQLTDEEIQVITWWIDQGAPFEKTLAQLTGHDEQATAIESVTAGLAAALDAAGDDEHHDADPQAVAAARDTLVPAVTQLQAAHPGAIRYLDAQSAGLDITSFDRPWNDQDLLDLEPVAHAVRRLVLPWSGLTPKSAAVINRMTALEHLDLRHAQIDDAFVDRLDLPPLRRLNLYGTAVTDASAAALSAFRSLETLYLGGTGFTADGIAQLRDALSACDIRHDAVPSTVRATTPKAKAKPKAATESKLTPTSPEDETVLPEPSAEAELETAA